MQRLRPMALLVVLGGGLVGGGAREGGALVGASFAQEAGAPAPQANAPDAEAKALLEKVRATYANLRAMSARAVVRSERYSESTKDRAASFAGVRAQVGDWKIAVREEGQGEGEGAKRGVDIAYDGASARSLRHKEKAVAQRTLVKVSDVRSFFVQQDAGQFVPWEALGSDELDAPGGTRVLGKLTIDGAECTLLELVQTPPLKAGEKDDGRPREIVVLAVQDQGALVRRIERVQEAPGGKRFTRVLTLEGLKINDEATAMDFSPATPDGYAVRTRGGSASGGSGREKGGKLGGGTKGAEDEGGEAGAQAGREGSKPHGVTWPHEPGTLTAGTPLPEFSLKNPKGDVVTNKTYAGKVMVVDVWGTWCPPCRAAMPALQRVHDKFKGKPVAVVGFNYERAPNADPVAFKKQNNYTYDLLLEAGPYVDAFKVGGFPTFYVVGADGKVVWGGTGLMPPPGVTRATPRQSVEYLEATLTKLVEGELAKLEAVNAKVDPDAAKVEEAIKKP